MHEQHRGRVLALKLTKVGEQRRDLVGGVPILCARRRYVPNEADERF